MRKTLFILFVLLSLAATAQTPDLNQLDSAGKKNGKWLVYLNSYFKEVKDSSKATYCRYTWYDHGFNVYMSGSRNKNWSLSQTGGSNQKIGKLKLLDGEYKWTDKKRVVRWIDVLKNGEYISCSIPYRNGKLQEYYNYKKLWKGHAHTYFIYIYDKRGNVEPYAMQKGVWGWMGYGFGNDSTFTDTIKVVNDSLYGTFKGYTLGRLVRQYGFISFKNKHISPKDTEERKLIYNGSSEMWYYSGQKKTEGQCEHGKRIGTWHYWDAQGKALKPKTFTGKQSEW